ncbi:MAG: STAS domain-containing protein [Phycisphaerales bacterium]|nr:STAS domain-containing protein [Phycisphaerales bacterium]
MPTSDQLTGLLEILKSHGFSTLIAVLLVWHFLHLNRAITRHNQELIRQLSELRENMHRWIAESSINKKLAEQNDRLMDELRDARKDSEQARTASDEARRESETLLRQMTAMAIGKSREDSKPSTTPDETSAPRSEEASPVVVRRSADVFIVGFRERKILEECSVQEIGDELQRLIDSTERPKLLLDFSLVDHFSSAALGMMIGLLKRATDRRGELAIASVGQQQMAVFKITRLNKAFRIFESLDAGVAALSAPNVQRSSTSRESKSPSKTLE